MYVRLCQENSRILYTCSRISYTSVLVSVYMLYIEGVMRYSDIVWKARIRDSYSRCRISYSLLHKSVYMIYTAWSRKGTDMFRRRYVYRFLHSWKDYPYMTLQRSVYFTYTVGSIRYRYYCCFKVGIRILIRFMTRFQAKYQCTHEYCMKTVVCVLWGL